MYQSTYEHIEKHIHLLKIDYKNGLILNRKVYKDGKGYFIFRLADKTVKIHNVIAFIKFGRDAIGSQNDVTVNHKDANKCNNTPDNLELLTNEENIRHASENGLLARLKGELNPVSKLSEDDVINILFISLLGIKHRHIAKKHNVSRGHVSGIIRGSFWPHMQTHTEVLAHRILFTL
ncbi:HNH endonuclease [Bacillus cereus group sp. BfR-BA-01310]|uniref:HNH endonuclease n=1 Tax=Bacillus cereus group sp. BfR-BA-01310 TaxID=2920287 RepID=UPI001F5761F9|nr:HNH endonuclease [Bacillus cereus group sp. BfR-BA-01310]